MRLIHVSEEQALVAGPVGTFDEQEMFGLAEPVKRYLRSSIGPHIPLSRSVRIEMRGEIKLGRWLPFRAEELLAPHSGFVWAARAAGVIVGSDRFIGDRGEMRWRLGGLTPVAQVTGPDVSRSAAERAAAEAVWVPTALMPRFGVQWKALDADNIEAEYQIAGYPIRVQYELGSHSRPLSLSFTRWGDPDGSGEFGAHRFGGLFTAFRRFRGLTIPTEGSLGWRPGTDNWQRGEFFRYKITDLVPFQ